MSEEKKKLIPLCYRCEWRARFLETGIRPRYECGDIKQAKFACYMFRPCKPVVVAPLQDDDLRPLSANYLSCRYKGVRIAKDGLVPGSSEEIQFAGKELEDGLLLYWELKEEKK